MTQTNNNTGKQLKEKYNTTIQKKFRYVIKEKRRQHAKDSMRK
ncbi:8670_t:CDS:2, partial [Gigaspora margarita]